MPTIQPVCRLRVVIILPRGYRHLALRTIIAQLSTKWDGLLAALSLARKEPDFSLNWIQDRNLWMDLGDFISSSVE